MIRRAVPERPRDTLIQGLPPFQQLQQGLKWNTRAAENWVRREHRSLSQSPHRQEPRRVPVGRLFSTPICSRGGRAAEVRKSWRTLVPRHTVQSQKQKRGHKNEF